MQLSPAQLMVRFIQLHPLGSSLHHMCTCGILQQSSPSIAALLRPTSVVQRLLHQKITCGTVWQGTNQLSLQTLQVSGKCCTIWHLRDLKWYSLDTTTRENYTTTQTQIG